MDQATTATRVKHVVAEICGDIAFDAVQDDQQLLALGLDSLDRVELLIELEREFSIALGEDTFDALESETVTVLQLVQAVEQQLNPKKESL